MPDSLQQRANERKIYEELVNIIVNYVYKEFEDEAARLRIYLKIADNFEGMARSLSKPPPSHSVLNMYENSGEFGESDG